MNNPQILLVTYPAQGHINPALQFAKRLINLGTQVTLATAVYARRRMSKTPELDGLSFITYSDGYDDGFILGVHDVDQYMSDIERIGSQNLTDLILSQMAQGHKFTCVAHTILIPWVTDVARALDLPTIFLWIQPATVLDIYYYYFNGFGDVMKEKFHDPTWLLELPGLPYVFSNRDLPSFISPSTVYTFVLPRIRKHFEQLKQETNPIVLVNTFDPLEDKALRALQDKLQLIPVGPLVPSWLLDGQDRTDTSFSGDLFHGSNEYIEWLNAKPLSSVIYVSFGSIASLSKQQREEIAHGLLNTGRPFLWVIRDEKNEEKEDEILSCKDELEQQGKIVSWCSQLEVLSHPSLGCFLTHCGWNSTLESLVWGVPLMAYPQWTDQGTTAKLIEEVWKIGVRVNVNQEGVGKREEIKRCVDLIMGDGETREEVRNNAKNWKELAKEAALGSSHQNLKAFVDEVGRRYC